MSLIEDGLDVRPGLLFSLSMTVAAALTAIVLIRSGSEGVFGVEANVLTSQKFTLFNSLEFSALLPQALISLALLNLPLASIELATIFQSMIAVISLSLLFELVRGYYSPLYATIAVLIVSTSPLYLTTSSWIGSIWLSFAVLVATILALLRLRRGHWLGYILLPLLAGMLVSFGVTGAILATVALAAIGYTVTKHKMQRPNRWTVVAMSLSIVFVVAVYWLFISNVGWDQFLQQYKLPQLTVLFDNLKLLFWGGVNPFGWPINWPLWNIPYWGMALLGLVVAIQRRNASRYQLYIALTFVLMVSLSLPLGAINLALSVLVGVLLVTAGLRYMIQNWEFMLPRNRVRHLISGVLLVAILAVIINGPLTRQFILRPSTNFEQHQYQLESSRDLYTEFRQSQADTL